MKVLLQDVGVSGEKLQVLDKLSADLTVGKIGIAEEIANEVEQKGYANFFLEKANRYLDQSHETYYKLIGFEDLELSTQVLLKEAIKCGLKFKFLDRQDNFIELSNNKNITQIIKQATKTATDNYAAISIMENKQVSKDLIARHGIKVAGGESYHDLDSALIDYPLFMDKSVVVKPNSTNFGVGITIFKEKFTKEAYKKALQGAFLHDKQVLVEDFILGREFKFFVVDNAVVAILQVEPANVVGDGLKTIRELVMSKNQNPFRDKGWKTPLERIDLERIEKEFLAEQNLTFDSVIANDEKVYLRENSSLSTGGDSVECTDLIPNSYKRIAVDASLSVGAKICSVDMMIKNMHNPYPDNNYTVLELNFNPAIYSYAYPYQGNGKPVAEKVLELLNLI